MPRTHIQRSVRETVRATIVGVGGLGLGVFCVMSPSPLVLVGAMVILPLSLYSLWQAWAQSYVAACPSCALEINELSPSGNDGVLCPHCYNFVEGGHGWLNLTAPDRLADKPLFGGPLFAESIMPPVCSLCLQAATRRIHLERSVVVRGQRHSRTVTIGAELPFCDLHDSGVVVGFDPSPRIFFRSHQYLREFCRVNNAKPVSLQKHSKR